MTQTVRKNEQKEEEVADKRLRQTKKRKRTALEQLHDERKKRKS